LPEVLEREGITPYQLSKALAERQVSRTTVYRWAKDPPALLDLELMSHVLWALGHITGKPFELRDVLEIQPSPEPDAWLEASAQDLVERLGELEKEVLPEELEAWLEAMVNAAKPARYLPGKGLVVEGQEV
jgi:hypothetical protein